MTPVAQRMPTVEEKSMMSPTATDASGRTSLILLGRFNDPARS
jgi:hypothetical protein